MHIPLKTVIEISLGLLGLATAIVVTIGKIKEVKARKINKLEPNPKRCIAEAERITALEGQNKVWLTRFDSIDKSLDDVKGSLKTLTDLHLKN